jgi:phosphate-selective porin
MHFQGHVADVGGYKVEYAFAANTLRDAYIKVALGDLLGVETEGVASIAMMAGQHKVVFSRFEMTSSNSINTVERPMIVRALAPAYDVGLFFNNSYMDGKLAWWASITNGIDSSDDEMAYSTRVVFNPFMGEEDNDLESLSLGLNCYYENMGSNSGSSSGISTGWISTATGGTYGFEHQTSSSSSLTTTGTARGLDVRVGLDAHWHCGQFGVTAEGIWSRAEQPGPPRWAAPS